VTACVRAALPVPTAERPRGTRASWDALGDAADRGEAAAPITLGDRRALDINAPRDPAEGGRLIALAAAAGHVRARYALGVLLARRDDRAAPARLLDEVGTTEGGAAPRRDGAARVDALMAKRGENRTLLTSATNR
jgi:TPR repeat protein